jgi:hypothetical protein
VKQLQTMDTEIRHYASREALRDLAPKLRAAGLPSATIPGMDAEFLAEDFEGEHSGAVVAYDDGVPFAYLTYAFSWKQFRPAVGPLSLGRLPVRQLRIFGLVGVRTIPDNLLDRFFELLLNQRGWHIGNILEVSPDDPLVRRLGSAQKRPRYRMIRKDVPTVQVKLDDTFESYLKKRFTKKARYNLRREVRLLDEAVAGDVEIKIYHSPADVEQFMRDAGSIARLTYQWKIGMNALRVTPQAVKKTSYLAAVGRWRSYILYIRGVPAAYCYATIRHGELSYDVVGYDPQFAKLNPGKVLLFKILEELHQSRIVDALDFGRGLADYKLLFANGTRPVVDLSLFPYNTYSQFLWLLAGATEVGYHCLHPLFRHWMPWIKRIVQRTLGVMFPTFIDETEIFFQLIILN